LRIQHKLMLDHVSPRNSGMTRENWFCFCTISTACIPSIKSLLLGITSLTWIQSHHAAVHNWVLSYFSLIVYYELKDEENFYDWIDSLWTNLCKQICFDPHRVQLSRIQVLWSPSKAIAELTTKGGHTISSVC